jgi:hypothetical protein
MSADLIPPAAHVCGFALGCALIHAARAHAAAITHLLLGVAVIAAALVLIEAAIIFAPDPQERFDEISVHAALSVQPAGLELESAQGP